MKNEQTKCRIVLEIHQSFKIYSYATLVPVFYVRMTLFTSKAEEEEL